MYSRTNLDSPETNSWEREHGKKPYFFVSPAIELIGGNQSPAFGCKNSADTITMECYDKIKGIR